MKYRSMFRATVSLRAIFIVLSLLCIVLAIVVDGYHRQGKAVVAIERMGGTVTYDVSAKSANPLRWLFRAVNCETYFADVVAVELPAENFTDEALGQIRHMRALKVLENSTSKNGEMARVTNAGLLHISGQKYLEQLNLSDTLITDAGLRQLPELPNLETLSLKDTHITDQGAAELTRYRTIRRLDLRGTEITERGLVFLNRLTNLEELQLGGMSSADSVPISDEGLRDLHALTRLRVLNVPGTHITPKGVLYLRDVAVLREIHLNGHYCRIEDVQILAQAFPQATITRHVRFQAIGVTPFGDNRKNFVGRQTRDLFVLPRVSELSGKRDVAPTGKNSRLELPSGNE
jgi:hypothetical protein